MLIGFERLLSLKNPQKQAKSSMFNAKKKNFDAKTPEMHEDLAASRARRRARAPSVLPLFPL